MSLELKIIERLIKLTTNDEREINEIVKNPGISRYLEWFWDEEASVQLIVETLLLSNHSLRIRELQVDASWWELLESVGGPSVQDFQPFGDE